MVAILNSLVNVLTPEVPIITNAKHDIYTRTLADEPNQDLSPLKFLNQDGLWIQSYYEKCMCSHDDDTIVIIVHGYLEDQRVWKSLKDTFIHKGFHVGGIDFPSHGKSEGRVAKCTDVKEWTNTIIQFLDLLQDGTMFGRKNNGFKKFVFFGHLFGAFVLLNLLLLEANLLSKYEIVQMIFSSPTCYDIAPSPIENFITSLPNIEINPKYIWSLFFLRRQIHIQGCAIQ